MSLGVKEGDVSNRPQKDTEFGLLRDVSKVSKQASERSLTKCAALNLRQ